MPWQQMQAFFAHRPPRFAVEVHIFESVAGAGISQPEGARSDMFGNQARHFTAEVVPDEDLFTQVKVPWKGLAAQFRELHVFILTPPSRPCYSRVYFHKYVSGGCELSSEAFTARKRLLPC